MELVRISCHLKHTPEITHFLVPVAMPEAIPLDTQRSTQSAQARDEPGRKSPKKIHYFGTSPEEIVSISALLNHILG